MATYEMFWDCDHCGTEKLLGLTHRHCPGCGAPQDPGRRYFPAEDEKVAVEDHRFVGADKACPGCDTPNAAVAAFCVNCGSPLEAASEVGGQGEVLAGAQAGARKAPTPPKTPMSAAAPPPEPSGGRKGCLGGMGCLGMVAVAVIVLAILCCVGRMWTQDATLTVTGHQWGRTIAVEELRMVRDSGWCDAMPSGAQELRRVAKERSTRRVPDGETCRTVNVDNRDGSFRKEERCTPKTRSEPVMGDHCTYEVRQWKLARTERAGGTSTSPAPSWPVVKVDGCAQLGCTREGSRRSTHELLLAEPDGTVQTCDVDPALWASTAVGSRWTAPKRVLGGGLDCGALSPAGGG